MTTSDLQSKIIHNLNEAQNGLHHHHKLIKTLKEVLEQEAPSVKDFFDVFFPPLRNVLVVLKREPAAERLVEFVAKFAITVAPKKPRIEGAESSSEEEEEEDEMNCQQNLLHLLMSNLICYLEAKEKAVRFRVCQILSKIFTFSYDDSSTSIQMSSSLLEDLTEKLIHRLHDRYPLVRLYASLALSYLQDPSDADCPVTSALMWSMEHDSNFEVRRCIVLHILITQTTLPTMITRTKDTKDIVRRCAFLILSEKCSIRHLTIKQRIQLLSDGLRDHSVQVREACTGGLLRSWCLTLDGDFLQLLRRLDVESSPDVAELVLMSLFDDISDEELVKTFESNMSQASTKNDEEDTTTHELEMTNRLLPLEMLDCELTFYWRCLCKYFKQQPEGLAFSEQIMPTLSQFCSYLQSFMETEIMGSEEDGGEELDNQISQEFVARQLCGIIPSLDFTDEVGRRQLGQLIYTLVINPAFPASLVTPLMAEQTSIWPQESYRVEKLIDIIADIRYSGMSESASNDSQLANLSYLDLKDDVTSLIKCLAVAGEVFKELKPQQLTPILQTLLDSLLLPCVQNENPYVRDLALYALGLACLLNVNLARSHILLFIQVSQVDHENVQATALKVVFDLLHLYGLEAFSAQQEQGEEEEVTKTDKETESEVSSDIINELLGEEAQNEEQEEERDKDKTARQFLHILAEFLDGESSLLREVTAEGLAKLLLATRVVSVPLLVRLLLLWYNPTLQEEDRLRAVLGHFFPAFASTDQHSRANISESYLPFMQTLLEAPPTSPLVDVDINNASDFVINLSAPPHKNEDSPHDNLALQVVNHLLSGDTEDDIVWLRAHCRALTLMSLTPSNKSNARDILTLTDQLVQSVQDRHSLRNLTKFKVSLEKIASLNSISHNDRPDHTGTDKENIEEPPLVLTESGTPPRPSVSPHSDVAKSPAQDHTHNQSVRSSRRKRTQRKTTSKTIDDNHDNVTPRNVRKSTKANEKTQNTKSKRKGKGSTHIANEEERNSDDSLVGEHSPFVRTRSSKRMVMSDIPEPLVFSDDD